MMLQRLRIQTSTFNSLLAVLHCLLFLLPVVSASCKDHVKKYCGNMGCQQGLLTKMLEMQEACSKLRNGETDECDQVCQEGIMELLRAYNGSEGLFTCNCTDTEMFYGQSACELDRRRLVSCPPLVALFQTEVESSPCISASQECEGDAACKASLDAYLQNCNPEQSDPETTPCSSECIGALEALKLESLASNFWECSCEDSPEEWCRTSPLEYYQLCQGHIANMSTGSPEVPYKPLTTKPSSPPTKVEGQNQQQGSTNDSKNNGPSGNSAPTINIQAIYQIGLVASIFWVLCYI